RALLGFFNFARSYWKAASALQKLKLKTTHPESSVAYLYYHAIELYLKAFLRMHGHTVDELQRIPVKLTRSRRGGSSCGILHEKVSVRKHRRVGIEYEWSARKTFADKL